jgi:hypothetical protein
MPLSPDPIGIDDVVAQHGRVVRALTTYFRGADGRDPEEFVGLTNEERDEVVEAAFKENDYTHCLSLLAALEAALKLDRVARKSRNDPLSETLKSLRSRDVHLGRLIRVHHAVTPLSAEAIALCEELARFRNWLAHGRFFVLVDVERPYGFAEVARFAEAVSSTFSLTA